MSMIKELDDTIVSLLDGGHFVEDILEALANRCRTDAEGMMDPKARHDLLYRAELIENALSRMNVPHW